MELQPYSAGIYEQGISGPDGLRELTLRGIWNHESLLTPAEVSGEDKPL
jgi:hypothetical protein